MSLFSRPPSFEELRRRADEMRWNPTPAERRAYELFAAAFGWRRFRAQWVVGWYIVDVLFPAERLVVELEGQHHLDGWERRYDARRDRFLRGRGHHVIRVPNEAVFQDPAWVVDEVAELLDVRSRWYGRQWNGRTRL